MSSKKLDAAIDALVDALADLPNTSVRGGSAGTGWGCESYASFSALSGHRAGDGAGSPQVGLSALPAPLDHRLQ